MREQMKINTQKRRHELMDLLGGKVCVHCGFDDVRILQFDHKNGFGCKDLKKHGDTRALVRFYLKNPLLAKSELQVLCPNCNWIKAVENKELQSGKP